MKISQQLQIVKKNIEEINTLFELYSEDVYSKPRSETEAKAKREEAKYIRDRILKISLANKEILSGLEKKEKI
ncbi:hypothetical protein HN587_07765 [Candidatus Woesearchaeota archaeon]|nr:hypothetical protein [Candidatus Woesearchaeota archaeon]